MKKVQINKDSEPYLVQVSGSGNNWTLTHNGEDAFPVQFDMAYGCTKARIMFTCKSVEGLSFNGPATFWQVPEGDGFISYHEKSETFFYIEVIEFQGKYLPPADVMPYKFFIEMCKDTAGGSPIPQPYTPHQLINFIGLFD